MEARTILNEETFRIIYYALVHPYFYYGFIWETIYSSHLQKLNYYKIKQLEQLQVLKNWPYHPILFQVTVHETRRFI